jgi:hypothetical protein
MENGSAPATKQDINELRSETKHGLEQLRSGMNHQYNDVLLQAEKRLNIPPTQ